MFSLKVIVIVGPAMYFRPLKIRYKIAVQQIGGQSDCRA
ncbi:MAG: hypothetical protein OFPI_32870 [Osedax symbiont Rs2]|nr:MAG: hypothetical protein OFPI_32870 [Osedax symbiont Rs2]